MAKTSPFKLDRYHGRTDRVNSISKPDNMYAKAWFANLAVAAFVFIDLFCLKVVWNLVQTEDPLYVWCVAFACAAALDVPMAIAAIAQKRYQQGMYSKQERNIVVFLSIAVFVVAFVFSLGFRVLTRDLSFDIGTGSTMTNTMATTAVETDTDNSAVWFAALFNGVIPLLTSISSFVVSYFGCDPLGMKIVKLEKERIGLQSNILEGEKALAEVGTVEEHCRALIARENDLYAGFMQRLDADALEMKQLVRVLLMEKLGTPEDVTTMTESGAKLMEQYEMSDAPAQELPSFIDNQLTSDRSNEYYDENCENVIPDIVDYAA